MVTILARKGSIEEGALRNRILDTVQFIVHLAEGDCKQLEILGHFLFNPSSLVLSESVAVLTPYMFSRGLKSVPVLVFRDTGQECFYRSLVEDMERLRMDAKAIWLPPARDYSAKSAYAKVI